MTTDALPTATGRAARRRLARLIRDRIGQTAVVLVIAVCAVGAQLLGPAMVGLAIDAVTDFADGTRTSEEATRVVMVSAGVFAAAGIVSAVLSWLGTVRAAQLGESALAEIRTEAFDHAMAVDVDRIERSGSGDLVARLASDVTVLGRAVRDTVPLSLLAAVEIALTVVALIALDVRLAAVAVAAGAPAATIGLAWYARHAPGRYRSEREAVAGLTDALLEGYSGRTTLAAYRTNGDWLDATTRLGDANVAAQMSTTAARNRLRPSIRVSLAGALAAVLGAGAARIDAGTCGVGAVCAAMLYVIRLFEPIGGLRERLDEIQQATAASARLVGVIELDVPATSSPPRTGDLTEPAIRLDGVSFGYGDGPPVVHQVSLVVERGERVAIIGASGAGKSTLAKLIVGFHQPDVGTVSLATDHDRTSGPPAVLVTQEAHAVLRSIRDNVNLGAPDADDHEVERSLRAATAWPWVEQLGDVDPLDNDLAQPDRTLTPVQRQQLALARLACASPSIVVLDEATSSLDPIAAASTEAALELALEGRTVLTIAHRLDIAPHVDRIVVMGDGRVVADGSHRELLDTSETYRSLWEAWATARATAM
mgnify:CR=1 FL=1